MSGGVQRVRGKGHTTVASVTRPADTTPYTAGDVIGSSILTFPNASFGEFDHAILQQAIITSSAYSATPPDVELWLFDTTVTAATDNDAFAPTDAELATLVGIIPFPTASWKAGTPAVGANGNMAYVAGNLGIPFNTKKGRSDLFGALVVRNAYTPVSSEVITVRLQILD